jgi:DNA (cytosine-5)-methyltransferase 1
MKYPALINKTLRPVEGGSPLVVDLFAGCGGLSLGFEAQGFKTVGFEMNADCVATYNENLAGICHQETLTSNTKLPQASVLIGGPPCQPFSVGGNQMGVKDMRDGFPIFISAVQRLKPELWLFENVRGLFYRNKWYLDQILDELKKLDYVVDIAILNAIDYDVPQNRERVFVIGHKGGFKFPEKASKRITAGEALGKLALEIPPESKFLTASMDRYIAKYEKASACINPRDLRLDSPARTLTCRNLAGATGDMQRIKLPDGRRRRLLVREAARLQSFPDWFNFTGGETSRYTQIGNAVPPFLAYHVASAVREYLVSRESVRFTPTKTSAKSKTKVLA